MPVKPELEPNVFRFYFGAIAVGMVWGITWTLAVEHWVKWPYRYQTLYSFAGAIFVWQMIHLYRENKRLKILQAAIDKDWADLMKKHPDITELESYKVWEDHER